MKDHKNLIIGLIIGLVTGISLSVFVWCIITISSSHGLRSGVSADGSSIQWDAVDEKLETIQRTIDVYYKDEFDQSKLVEGIYKGFVAALGDPYSTYYTKEEYDEMMESSSGTYCGIGAYLQQNENDVSVMRPIPGSPAEEAGILAGDVFTEVDGESVAGEDVTTIAAKVRGPEDTSVTVTLKREGEKEPLVFELIRREIETPTVEHEMLDDGIGYIAILEFDDITLTQFETALQELRDEDMTALVLDLRDNPGGNLDIVVKIADDLLQQGLVVYTEDKYGTRQEFTSDAAHSVNLPMAVLINENSASAAEILAGAIKDYQAGTLIGTTTFGKGIVQQVLPLGDGTGIKVTTSKYYTPNGNDIHGIGIEPDIELEFDEDAYEKDENADNQLDRAVELLSNTASRN